MKVNAIWDIRICKDLMESSNLGDELDALLDAVHCVYTDDAFTNYSDDLFQIGYMIKTLIQKSWQKKES